jgi:undecaprenyl-diphosphatase
MNIIESIVIAIVEGLTEYLPISSTGHMIITSSLMDIHKDEFTKIYEVVIQLGAIMAVVVLYWRKFLDFSKWQFYARLIVAVIPALVLGKILSDTIDQLLESPLTVAITLFLGGIVLLFIDRYFVDNKIDDDKELTYKQSFFTGLWQCIALIPGVSRSAASIIGGMQQGMSRRLAAEFSFFLAVPTMFAATVYKLYSNTQSFSSEQVKLLVVGNIVAFIVAIIAIRFFIGFLQKHGFRFFGWYRIIAGIILFVLIASGVIKQ